MASAVRYDLEEVLRHVDASRVSYQEWTEIGMALKAEGYTVQVWDQWSQTDGGRYHPMECYKKWATFNGEGVNGGTIVAIAREYGYDPYTEDKGRALEWDDWIGTDKPIIDEGFAGTAEVKDMGGSAVKQLSKYLSTLFEPDEVVGYVTETYEIDGEWKPKKGTYTRTAGDLLESLKKHPKDVEATVGTIKPEVGAWIRINPLDGKGVSDKNVTDYRFALVEADHGDLEEQLAIIKALHLPAAAILYSGGKSIHAVVHIDAGQDEKEYQKRVKFLFQTCQDNGLQVDMANKNPSRLSRMPGVMRNRKKQFLIELNAGAANWDDWVSYLEGKEDENWPDAENTYEFYDEPLDDEEEIIEGVLYEGRKMLLAGESKGGKTFAAMQLAYAIVSGGEWMGNRCTKGKVLYVNTEMHRKDFMRRQRAIERNLKLKKKDLKDLDVVHTLRCNRPLSKGFAAYLLRLVKKKDYKLVIIDPIYKILEGDESDAAATNAFTNELDKLVDNLGIAVVYVHHFTKGAQGQKKSIDRASGSGIFARDADAVVSITSLEKSTEVINYLRQNLNVLWPNNRAKNQEEAVEGIVPTRVEMNLRAFAKKPARNYWFKYPVHYPDKEDILKDAKIAGSSTPGDAQKAKAQENVQMLEDAFDVLKQEGPVYLKVVADSFDRKPDTIKQWVRKSDRLVLVKEKPDDRNSRVIIEEREAF